MGVVLAAVIAGAVPGCGGGDNNPIPTACISFEASAVPAGSTVVARQASGSTCGTLQVELVLTGVTDVQTVEFKVDFDGSVASYEGLSLDGSMLASGGANVNVFEDEDPGRITINLSRFGSGVDFVPDGTVVRLVFGKATGADTASGMLSFSATQIFDSAEPPQEKSGIQWFGGTFRVAR
jgi:hypothetical protein